jgi:hypothetical protein
MTNGNEPMTGLAEPSDASRFLVGIVDGDLIVMPLDEARRLAVLNDALENATTWGQFLSLVARDHDTLAYIADRLGPDLPSEAEDFDPEDIPGFAESEWPLWPKRGMLEWLPESVKVLGSIKETLLSGAFLQCDAGSVEQVIAALREEGFESVPDADELLDRACGTWRYA